MNETTRTKIGPNHGKPHTRIWLEGQRVRGAGFTPGLRYRRTIEGSTVTLTLDATGQPGTFKVSGKGEKPIIDFTGAQIAALYPPPATHVTVTYAPGIITIQPSA